MNLRNRKENRANNLLNVQSNIKTNKIYTTNMKTHLAYIYRKIFVKLTIILAYFGFKKLKTSKYL
jgi:hypothetical protein